MNIFKFFFDKCIKNYLRKFFIPKRVIHTVDKKQVPSALPFLGPLFFEIRFKIVKLF